MRFANASKAWAAGQQGSFEPMSMKSGASGGNYSAAAGVVDVGKGFEAMRAKAPRYDQLSAEAMKNQSMEKQAAMQAEASVTANGLAAFGQAKGAQIQAQATIQAAKAQAEASKSSGMMSAIGSIASAGLGLLSDETTKTAIVPIESALEKLRELKPVTFYYKPEFGDHTRKHHGFIAQEFEQVLPDATYVDAITKKKCIDVMDVVGLLVRGNQELQYRVTRLEAKLALQAV